MLITAAYIVFLNKSQNDIVSLTFVLQVICFITNIKDKSFPAKRVSLENEFPCKTTFAHFQRPHLPVNKGQDFPPMKGVLRVLILC